jgi:hypothetical protein
LAADDDELLAKDQVFGDQGCPGAAKARTMSNRKRRKASTAPSAYHVGLFLAGSRSGAAMATSPSERPDQIPLTYGVFEI